MMTRLPRSAPPSPQSGQRRSTTSWTTPEPGDILCYSYLWHREAIKGQTEGLKDRPVVVVVALRTVNERTELLVAPITHSHPQQDEDAVEIPQRVKRHLGLDQNRSWIITTEINRFFWPGPDIRPVHADGSPLYGAIPAQLFETVKAKILAAAPSSRFGMTKRSE